MAEPGEPEARSADPPRRREPPDVRRAQILDAAERLLVDRGLRTSIAEIADAAGVAKGTVYLYFASRDDLLAALRARYLERFVDTVGGTLATRPSADAARTVVAFADALFDWGMQHVALHHVLFHEAGVSEQDAFELGRALLTRLVADGVETGTVRVGDPELCARALLDAIHGLLVATMDPASPQRERYDRAVRELVPRVLGTTLS